MMRLFASFLFTCILCMTAQAQTIGVSLPLSGKYAAVAEKIRLGVELAFDDLNANGANLTLQIADDACDLEKADAVAQTLSDAEIIVGPVCFESARAIAALTQKKVIALNTNNGALKRARTYSQLQLFTLSGTPKAEAQAIVSLGLPKFEGKPFALLDDGSVHGRNLADDIRLIGETVGFNPVAVANFRPLQSNQRAVLRRLQRSGVEALVVAGAPEDVTTIVRDMAALGYDWPVIVGDQAELLAFAENVADVPDGLLAVRSQLLPIVGNDPLKGRLEELDVIPERSIYEGYVLTQMAAQFVQSKDNDLIGKPVQTIVGPLAFEDDGRASHAPYGLLRSVNGDFQPIGSSQ